MPEWLSALLGSSAFVGAAGLAVRESSRALAERNTAQVARISAETERMLAEARVRESQARITEGDAEAIREALASVMRERDVDREEVRLLRAELVDLRKRFDDVAKERDTLRGAVLYETQARGIEEDARRAAEEREAAIRDEFRIYHQAVRAGRPPRHTPPSIRIDHTQPYGAKQ